MDIIDKLVGSIVGLIAFIYLIVNGLAPALVNQTTLEVAGTDYFWIIGLAVLLIMFGAIKYFYKGKGK